MAYYDLLITKWPTVAGADDAAKLVNLNSEKVTGPSVPAIIGTTDIINAIEETDLQALTSTQLAYLDLVLQGDAVNVSIGTTTRAALQAIFAGKPTTVANLVALVDPYDNPQIPWPQANGYPAINFGDLCLAGLVGSFVWSFTVVNVVLSGGTARAKVAFGESSTGTVEIRHFTGVATDSNILVWARTTVRGLAEALYHLQSVTIGGSVGLP